MGAYADTTLTDSNPTPLAQPGDPFRIGMPEATASTYTTDNGVGTPTSQSQSRPFILNRPLKSVAEMSYSFTGTPWKNIDFMTPESGDSALLDTFCVYAPPAGGMVAGKVDLNTRQLPVLQALVAGAYRDETNNSGTPPTYSLPPLNSTEANHVAAALLSLTTDLTDNWRGPLANVSYLVGHYVANPASTSAPDEYTYVPPSPANGETTSATYAGLSALLGTSDSNTVYQVPDANGALDSDWKIQRFREAAIRPLADCGQTRIWNLLIDIVAQTGNLPSTANNLAQFAVSGERHYWQHVAIDRETGQIIDQSIEEVAETPNDILANSVNIAPGAKAGSSVATLTALPGGAFTFTLVSGLGHTDNADFTINGNTLQTTTNLDPAQTTYTIVVQATGANGQSYQQTLTLTTSLPNTDTPTMPFWALASLAALLAGVGACLLPGLTFVRSR